MPDPNIPVSPEGGTASPGGIPRRTVTRAAAWSVPVAMAVVATPLAAASGGQSGTIVFDYPEYVTGPGMVYGTITGKVIPTPGTALPASITLGYPNTWGGPTTVSVNVDGTFSVVGVTAPPNVGSATLTASAQNFTSGTTKLTVLQNAVPPATDGIVWGENLDVTLFRGNASTLEKYAVPAEGLRGAGTLAASSVIAMAGGYRGVNSYLIRSDNTLWSHGDGGNATAPGTNQPVFYAGQFSFSGSTALFTGENFVDVVGFTGGGYVLTTHGRIFSWGYNSGTGSLGNGTFGPDTNIPKLVTIPKPDIFVTAISASYTGGIALDSKGRVWAWGINDLSDLGTGLTGNQSIMKPVVLSDGTTQLSGVTQIRGKFKGGYALRSDGTVYSWGDGTGYMNGNGLLTNQNYAAPVLTGPGTTLTGIKLLPKFYHEAYHSAALGTNNVLYTWGYGSYFVHDPASVANRQYATPYSGSLPTGTITDVALSYYGIHIRLSDGTSWNWGDGDYGQDGNGTLNTPQRTPVQTLTGPGTPAIIGGFFPNSHGGVIAHK
ncbi:hypothetical protein [Sinomonas sp. ASV322]|uniref:RCC1 domain-containing protein n=1 Tax=Sinomonas sp. ASV322 TaxID=3041920 RepID=UPI0027DB018F|nr:hypothetical protein [Sinomonas sp. ASV322]MDQ4502453.1 hypothetical protein [Sinomonas sp. ASV322]